MVFEGNFLRVFLALLRLAPRDPVARVALTLVSGMVLLSCGGGDGAAPTSTPATRPPPPAPTVTSLEVTVGIGILTSIGETSQLTLTATLSDGSMQAVEAAEADWESSDPAVATVSDGLLSAAGAGNATITVTFGGQSAEVAVSVRISLRTEGTVRVLYVSPADRQFRADYSEVITHAIVDVQSWYRRQMGGPTFQLYEATPEWCQMSGDSEYYGHGDIWGKVVEDVQHCAPVVLPGEHSEFTWVLYVDAEEACDDYGAALGAGGWGLTLLGGIDLNRMANGGGPWVYCDIGEYERPFLGYLGGLAHEFAHTLGVPHPPGCDEGLPTCNDFEALMLGGFEAYPDTYLRFDDKEQVIRSRFITGERMPAAGPDAAGDLPGVRGVVFGPTGVPLEGVRISAWADPFWTWDETGRDGTFTIGLPQEASGPVALSVHAPQAAECTWLGYHRSGGLTSRLDKAAPVERAESGALPVEIRLPGAVDELCSAQKTISGTVVGPDGRPLEGIWIRAIERHATTGRDGRFEILMPWWLGEFREALGVGWESCEESFGFYGRNGLTNIFADGIFEIGAGDPNLTIEVRLPASPAELCRRQPAVLGGPWTPRTRSGSLPAGCKSRPGNGGESATRP